MPSACAVHARVQGYSIVYMYTCNNVRSTHTHVPNAASILGGLCLRLMQYRDAAWLSQEMSFGSMHSTQHVVNTLAISIVIVTPS